MGRWSSAALLAPMLIGGCAGMQDNMQGPLEPQVVSGPCEVKRFFTLGQRSVPTPMAVANTGQTCSFLIFNPALNLTLAAAFVTGRPVHGQATADLVNGRRQVAVTYTPAPGYAGPDQFAVTWEPGGSGVTLNVSVRPGG